MKRIPGATGGGLNRFSRPFTQGFTRFLRRRRATRHFGRQPLPFLFSPTPVPAAPEHLTDGLLQAAAESPTASMSRLGSGEQGLSQAEAALRLARDGPNEIEHEKSLPGWRRLWLCYLNPFNLLLSVLAGLSWFSGDAKATTVIGLMVALSTLLRFIQEGRAH